MFASLKYVICFYVSALGPGHSPNNHPEIKNNHNNHPEIRSCEQVNTKPEQSCSITGLNNSGSESNGSFIDLNSEANQLVNTTDDVPALIKKNWEDVSHQPDFIDDVANSTLTNVPCNVEDNLNIIRESEITYDYEEQRKNVDNQINGSTLLDENPLSICIGEVSSLKEENPFNINIESVSSLIEESSSKTENQFNINIESVSSLIDESSSETENQSNINIESVSSLIEEDPLNIKCVEDPLDICIGEVSSLNEENPFNINIESVSSLIEDDPLNKASLSSVQEGDPSESSIKSESISADNLTTNDNTEIGSSPKQDLNAEERTSLENSRDSIPCISSNIVFKQMDAKESKKYELSTREFEVIDLSDDESIPNNSPERDSKILGFDHDFESDNSYSGSGSESESDEHDMMDDYDDKPNDLKGIVHGIDE